MEGLPTVNAAVPVYNRNYVRGAENSVYINEEREVEVLTLNLTTRTMRVRYTDVDISGLVGLAGKVYNKTADVSIDSFFNSYTITEKEAQ